MTWQVGDIAVRTEGYPNGLKGAPEKGLPVRVDGVYVSSNGKVGLRFNDYPTIILKVGWLASCFRKIRPDEHDACEPEFATLLNRSKQSTREAGEPKKLPASNHGD